MSYKDKWNEFWLKKQKEAQRVEELRLSVNCPFCKCHYSKTEVYDLEEETEMKDLSVIKCRQCDSIFGVNSHSHYDPVPAHWNTTIGLWGSQSSQED